MHVTFIIKQLPGILLTFTGSPVSRTWWNWQLWKLNVDANLHKNYLEKVKKIYRDSSSYFKNFFSFHIIIKGHLLQAPDCVLECFIVLQVTFKD